MYFTVRMLKRVANSVDGKEGYAVETALIVIEIATRAHDREVRFIIYSPMGEMGCILHYVILKISI